MSTIFLSDDLTFGNMIVFNNMVGNMFGKARRGLARSPPRVAKERDLMALLSLEELRKRVAEASSLRELRKSC